MSDFLLELRSEEIPARMQRQAREDLVRLFEAELSAAGLSAKTIKAWSTPRRLVLIARELPVRTEAVSEERRGPRADAPDKAIEGFLRSTGLERGDLEEREEKKGTFLYAVIDTPGRKTRELLAEAIPRIIRDFPWPKSMRWGAVSESSESLRWVRPLQGIVAIFDDDIVECEVGGVVSGADTVGHRFHHPGPITIGGAFDYAEKLEACHVIVDHKLREGIIREKANALAEQAGLTRLQDPALVEENAGLTEWPVPLLGSFDNTFLDVAPEAITLAMRTHQKYFALADADGDLAPNFICVANIEATDGGEAIARGNERVLAARLADARFFWEQDLGTKLEDHAKKLDQIVFHEKLGTVADKVDRVAKLARWLAEEGIVEGADPDKAERAARLAKADLVTGTVGEFPELQGTVGGYLAMYEGLDLEIANAIRDHYKPVGQGDAVPSEPVTVAVSLADKLDSLVSFFVAGERATGSRDPYALRRAALGIASLVQANQLRLQLVWALAGSASRAAAEYVTGPIADKYSKIAEQLKSLRDEGHNIDALAAAMPASAESSVKGQGELGSSIATIAIFESVDFIIDRLKVQQREAGVRHDLIDAVFALGGEDDLVRLLARVKALQDFVESYDGANLLAGYKRTANILKKEGFSAPAQAGVQSGSGENAETEELDSRLRGKTDYDAEPEEALLREAVDTAEKDVDAAIAQEDFKGAMAALAKLRGPIDAFFDNVTVNDEDATKRAARLGLLARFRDAVHHVADFSKIEG